MLRHTEEACARQCLPSASWGVAMLHSYKRASIYCDHQQRGVIVPDSVAEAGHCQQNLLLNLHSAPPAIFLEHRQQPLFTKLFLIGVARFGDAISENDHAVAALQLRYAALKRLISKNTQNAAAFTQALVRAIAVQNKGWIVPGAHIAQQTRAPIELRVKQSDEPIAGHVAVQQSVQSCAQFLRGYRRRRQATHGGLQIRHQQRRRQSLTRYIRDAQSNAFLIKRKHIEIISADDAGGLPRAGNFVSGQLRNYLVLLVKLRSDYFLCLRFLHRESRGFPALAP